MSSNPQTSRAHRRTWFITGVSSGFGRELTEQLLERGDGAVGTVRDTGKVPDLAERYPGAFRAEVLDMTDTPAIHAVVERSFAELGRIDVIISNAGYGLFGPAEMTHLAIWEAPAEGPESEWGDRVTDKEYLATPREGGR